MARLALMWPELGQPSPSTYLSVAGRCMIAWPGKGNGQAALVMVEVTGELRSITVCVGGRSLSPSLGRQGRDLGKHG